MDPSLSLSTDPHHQPQQFNPFPAFAAHNPFAGGFNPAVFGALPPVSAAGNNHAVVQAPPNPVQQPLPPHPSFNHPPYADMICTAIAALNEPDGSSKQAISRYIERAYTGLPPAHTALLTHHLKSLKNSGLIVMVKKSYKLAAGQPSTGLSFAATTLEPPRSNLFGSSNDQTQSDLTAASAPPKRGRGRPPKARPESLAGAQPSAADSLSAGLSNKPPGSHLNSGHFDLSTSGPVEETQATKRRPGRPRKNGAVAAVQAAPAAAVMKRRGRPPGRRGPGRPSKPKSDTAPATVFPNATNGPRRGGRPRRPDSVSEVSEVPPATGEGSVVPPPPAGKRRGRPPKVEGFVSKPMNPRRSSGRPVGRPRKNARWPTAGVPEPQAAGVYGELKRKLEFFQEKVKQAVDMLRDQVDSRNNVVISAINELEGLVAMDIDEQPAQEDQPHEQQSQPQPESLAEAEARAQAEAQAQAHAEAMEALF